MNRRLRPVESVIGWVTLLFLALSAVAYGGNLPLVWLILAVVVAFLFAGQLIVDLVSGSPSPSIAALMPSLLIYLAVLGWAWYQILPTAVASLANPSWAFVTGDARIAVDPELGRHFIVRLTTYAMIFWVMMRTATSFSRAKHFVAGTAVFSTLMACYGLVAFAFGFDWIAQAKTGGKLSSTYINPDSYAAYAGYGLLANLAAFALLVGGRTEFGSLREAAREVVDRILGGGWIFALGAALNAAALAMTTSRAGIFATAVGLLVFALALARSKQRLGSKIWVGAVLGLVALYALAIGFAPLATRLAALLNGPEPRFSMYRAVVEAIAARPFTGYGLGGFADAVRPFLPSDAAALGEWTYAHNAFLENALELGIPAAVALYAAFLPIVARLRRGARIRRTGAPIPAFALGVLVLSAVHSVFDFSLEMPATAAMFAAILGIGWSQSFQPGSGSSAC